MSIETDRRPPVLILYDLFRNAAQFPSSLADFVTFTSFNKSGIEAYGSERGFRSINVERYLPIL